ncbi:O-acetyl-ADP-ribose deacetylase (regulator of RNase III) [Trueperella bonasi]|uniref:O-acetyl-ADP-ribose deacetylase (Regulator of RNase III) n=1 Tax=Trueperella bonasi TaxID=312286 RepID=A0ABT9NGS3_9ACTO|nr:macro domain-containing protein [Trueperella bonasi]MDP9806385.1 O-acetyl-ADP-ribose deacetylase (regulator of RNase III) [Trueperella bonasi]
MLSLSEYKDAIKLSEPFPVPVDDTRSTYDLLMTALGGLPDKHYTGTTSMAHLSTDDGLTRWLEAELALREPAPLNPVASRAINTLLYRQVGEHGRVEAINLRRVHDLLPQNDFGQASDTVLYRGDMRQLVIDAVVNTALPSLTGCRVPLHGCLDSVLHAQAGPWMRNDCAKIMEMQGLDEEPPGNAKVTRGYRLPAKYVIHTVGPNVKDGKVEEHDRENLYNCYWNSLELAGKMPDIRSIAFPAIATGYNAFPIREAAQIALDAVNNWMDAHGQNLDLIVFSVQGEEDALVYADVLNTWID